MLKKISKIVVLILIIISIGFFVLYFSEFANKQKTDSQQPHYWKIKTPLQYFIDHLTLEEKIGQLLIVGFTPASMKTLPDRIKTYKYGGFILYKRNISDVKNLYDLTSSLKKWNQVNPLPVFIGLDEEGGTVSRLPDSATKFPDARRIGRVNDQNLTFRVGKVMGNELRALGVNLNFAPVLDILTNPKNYFLSQRVFGDNVEQVTRHGVYFIRGMRSENVIAVAKHFPGHGDTEADSHGRLPVIFIDRKTLLEREIIPYRYAVRDGLDALMVGHISFPNIDTTGSPATLSLFILKDILRNQLGFNGLAISDEIEMQAYMNFHDSLEQSIVQSFNSGIDMFIIGHTIKVQAHVYQILLNAVKTGTISKDRLDASIERILRKKLKYEVRHSNSVSFPTVIETVGSDAHRKVLDNIYNHNKGP